MGFEEATPIQAQAIPLQKQGIAVKDHITIEGLVSELCQLNSKM